MLPSLVAGLTWFATKLWETNERSNDVETIIPALHALLKPPSMSNDSSALHEAVLSIVARPLEDSLGYAQRQQPLRPDINPLLEALKPYVHRQRHESTFHSELESWSSTPGGGLLAALRHTVQSLTLWSGAFPTNVNMAPPHYTHRQLVATLKILGSKAVLQTLLDEILAHVVTGSSPDADVVLDIVVNLICAPQHEFPHPSLLVGGRGHEKVQHQMSLVDALNAEFSQAFEISKTDLPRATIIVQIQRRVEEAMIRACGDANVAGGDTDVLLQGVMDVAEGMPTADIDDVLVEADQQMAQGFLASGGGSFLAAG